MFRLQTKRYFTIFFGALTNKPHAFKFRAWELETTKNFDLFDILVENILIETRGSAVLRVLPLNFEFPEFNWLTDRSRFFFDSLKNQRVLEPFIFYKQDLKIQWDLVLSFIGYSLLKIKQNKMFSLASKLVKINKAPNFFLNCFTANNFNTDLKDSLASFNLKQLVGGAFCFQNNYVENFNQVPFLVTSLKPLVASVSSFFLLVNLDLRFEIPKLNLFLRQQNKNKIFKVFTIGVRLLGVTKFNFKNLGLSFATFLNIIEGRHWFNNLILKNKNVAYFYLGQDAHKHMASGNFYDVLNKFTILFNVKVCKLFADVNNLNLAVLNKRVSLFCFKQQRLESFLLNKNFLVFNMAARGVKLFSNKKNILAINMLSFKENFILSENFLKINLPVTTFFEREFHSYDLVGKIKKNSKILNAPLTEKGANKQRTIYNIFNVLNVFVSLRKKKETLLNTFFSKEQKLKSFACFTEKASFCVFFFRQPVFVNFVYDLYKQDEFSKNSLILNIAGNVFYDSVSNY